MSEKEIIEVVQAHMEGKQIQVSNDQGYSWIDAPLEPPCWNFSTRNYRIKPEPRKPREWTLVYNGGAMWREIRYGDIGPCEEAVRVREVIE